MKIRIIKPFSTSGYFTGSVVEIEADRLEEVKANNIIEIIEEIATIPLDAETAIPKKRGRKKKE
ncbi:hypothetical protein KI659_17990 [Litoribacter alkaliphilus]|uniref:Uncharacterized protein n=1 Tax=Litoribacter ruber TaxID=702568 RepID=A0AAP2CKP2_9BACT|nr:hypothetical protein [Litoribacter alkaliphilus]MBS9525917.1 hypothetical protein [Litoribacter alkaliphilus]